MKTQSPKRKRRRRLRIRPARFGCFIAVILAGAALLIWALQPQALRQEKNALHAWLFGLFHQDTYDADALLVTEPGSGAVWLSLREDQPQPPASLAKLFVAEYAATLAPLESTVPVSAEALALTKPGSSVAGIQAKDYTLENLFAAMLVPSGNDAAYAVADYCGGILSPQAAPGRERVQAFLSGLQEHLEKTGCRDTFLYDPSGFDEQSRTTALDLAAVTGRLMEQDWFRQMVSSAVYTARLPDGSTQSWQNTNAFLNPQSEYYDPHVAGVKTGSLEDGYNLVVLCRRQGRELLICSLGAQSDSSRYDNVKRLMEDLSQSSLLAG